MKRIKYVVAIMLLVIAAAACGKDASDTDLDQPEFNGDASPTLFEAVAPDAVQVFFNVDDHPNLVRLCIDGLAFITVSETHQAWTPSYQHVAEWDSWCAAQ